MSSICTKCGYQGNRSSAVSCEKCGAPIGGMKKKISNPFKLNFKREEEEEPKNFTSCKSCGYLMAQNIIICPNCNYDNSAKPMRKKDKTISFDQFKYSSKTGFKLLPHNNEQNILSFDGDRTDLHRENVDHTDMSISSEVHATINQEDGKWYIENHSSNEATFIQVKGKMEIIDGMVIILGQSQVFTFLDNNE